MTHGKVKGWLWLLRMGKWSSFFYDYYVVLSNKSSIYYQINYVLAAYAHNFGVAEITPNCNFIISYPLRLTEVLRSWWILKFRRLYTCIDLHPESIIIGAAMCMNMGEDTILVESYIT